MKNKKTIIIIGFDWDQKCSKAPEEILRKLRRDRIDITQNDIHLVGYSRVFQKGKIKENISFQYWAARSRHVRPLYDLFLVFKIFKYIKSLKNPADVCIFVGDSGSLWASVAPKIFFKSKVVFFLGNTPQTLAWVNKKYFRYLYILVCEFFLRKSIDLCFVISEATKKYAKSYLSVSDNKIISFVPDFVSQDLNFIARQDKDYLHKLFFLPMTTKIILSIGRLEPEKNFEQLIDFFSIYTNTRENVVLVIVGSGILEKSLKEKVKHLHLDQKIYFIEHTNRESVWQCFSSADMFVLISKSEGLGIVFLEAILKEVPIVGSPVGGIIDIIGSNEERGFFYKSTISENIALFETVLSKQSNVLQKVKQAHGYLDKILANQKTTQENIDSHF